MIGESYQGPRDLSLPWMGVWGRDQRARMSGGESRDVALHSVRRDILKVGGD